MIDDVDENDIRIINAIRFLDGLTADERLFIFLRYCENCGEKQPDNYYCQCGNDE